MLNPLVVVKGSELLTVGTGTVVRVYADRKHLGLPVPSAQSVVLQDVSFLPTTDEHPASVIGTFERTGNWLKHRHATGVVLHEDLGALAVRVDDSWQLGWVTAGWHPRKNEWCWLNNGTLRPLHYAPHAVAVGRHLFVRRPTGREHRRKACV